MTGKRIEGKKVERELVPGDLVRFPSKQRAWLVARDRDGSRMTKPGEIFVLVDVAYVSTSAAGRSAGDACLLSPDDVRVWETPMLRNLKLVDAVQSRGVRVTMDLSDP